ncbi:MAG: esterase/lipase family protein [Luteolibacter sp.]
MNWKILADPAKKSQWPAALAYYNKSVAILFDQLRCGKKTNWPQQAHDIGTVIAPENLAELAKTDSLFPASAVKFRTKETRRQEIDGIGIPAVSWTATSPIGIPRKPYHPPNGQPKNLTVTLDFSKKNPEWHFSKRWVTDTYQVGKTTHHLAADWTAPIDFFWYMTDLDNLRIQNVLLPDRFIQETGLYFLEPYDPTKIPVVMVHGLVSSPDAYRDIINDLSPEPWFREKYQIWLYNYPTGTPWLYNAMLFRQKMGQAANYARTKGSDENLKKTVILSHSMGGLLTRTAVSPPRQHLYREYFKTPFDQLKVKPETRTLIRESLLYQPLTYPKRVVFMAVPHQGSPAANFRGTAFLSSLVRLPKTLTVGLLDAALSAATDNVANSAEKPALRLPTSISSLSPFSPASKGLKNMPLPSDITFHSIIGDKGRGNTPDSSDGVVPYWSSHVEPVASELIVPSNHGVPHDPATSEEIKRILLLHLEENE